MKKTIILVLILLMQPLIAFAQLRGVKDLIAAAGGLINYLINVVIAIALLVFFWGLVKFIFRVGGDKDAVEEGRRLMVWGLITLFVMVSVWGIINFMAAAVLPGGKPAPPLPFAPFDAILV